FKIGSDGLPAFVETVAAGVREPRGFALDPSGTWLIAAGQRSNTVVTHRIDAKTGRLSPTGASISVGKPVCIVPVPAR
ncbi:lactonase family protein, partial [bacterium]